MPNNRKNASYENCINELHSRYDGRGLSASADREAAAQIKRENAAPNAYLVSRMSKRPVSENYRNGEFNGQKYMTTGDFLKYYNTRKDRFDIHKMPDKKPAAAQTKEFVSPARQDSAPIPAQKRAKPQTGSETIVVRAQKKHYNPEAPTIAIPSIREQKGVRAKVTGLINKWFPREDKKEETAVFKRNIPVAAIALIISSTIAMTMIIGSTVMASEANLKLSDLRYEVEALEAESSVLEEKLMKKEDLAEIKAYATDTLGMISKDYVAAEYISISSDESIQSFGEEEKAQVDFVALLSSIFGD